MAEADRKREVPEAEAAGDEAAMPTAAAAAAAEAPPAKRVRTEAAEGKHVPPKEAPTDPAELRAATKKQVEYYFSDGNMRQDKFFQDKIRNNAESWLHVDCLLSCRNIKRLGVTTPEFIVEALADSDLETKKDDTGTWVRRTTPLPELVEVRRTGKRQQQPKAPDMSSIHEVGCFSKAVGCPEEASWEAVKTALAAKLPDGARIRFVSELQSDGSCFIYTFKFDNDEEFFTKTVVLEVANTPVTVSLVTDPEEGARILTKVLPPPVAQQRQKQLQKLKKQRPGAKEKAGGKGKGGAKGAPLSLGGTRFTDIGHLRHCVRDLLQQTEVGKTLPETSNAYKVVTALLEYHPRAAEKATGLTGLKVGEVCKGGTTTRCYFVLRKGEDGTEVEEDFSVLKCIAELQKNPPAAADGDGEATPAASSAAAGEEKEKSTAASAAEAAGDKGEEEPREAPAAAAEAAA